MRWKEILTESPKRYEPMFGAILNLEVGDEMREYLRTSINQMIVEIERTLKKQDRIIWYLRWYRLHLLDELEESRNIDPAIPKLRARYLNEIGVAPADYRNQADYARDLQRLQHFAGTPSPKLQNVVWDKQPPEKLIAELTEIEREWQTTRDQEIYHTGDETVFLDLKNGWAWFDLETNTCSQEAKAMGHCGNAGGSYDQTILSLRRKIDDERYRPSLTFILKSDGFLGEMKGRANEKPNPKYHDAIKALLLDPRIVGIDGGGYAPENNFSLQDLEDEEFVRKLQAEKPAMRGVSHLYDLYVEKEGEALGKRVEQKIRDSLDERGYSYHKILLGEKVIRVDSWKDRDSYLSVYNSYTKMLHDFFQEELAIEIEHETLMISDKAERIAAAAADDLYTEMFDILLPYDCEYEVTNNSHGIEMYPQWKDGKIVLDLDIADYLFLFHDDEDAEQRSFGNGRIEYLDNVVEHMNNSFSDIGLEGYPPIMQMIFKHIENVDKSYEEVRHSYGTKKRSIPRVSSETIHAIIEHYKDVSNSSATIKDPNQMEFDFPEDNK